MTEAKPVSIQWLDSMADSGWTDRDCEMQLAYASSVGFLLETTEDSYILCRTYSKGAGIVEGRFSIPKSSVTRIRNLMGELEVEDLPFGDAGIGYE